MSNSSLVDYTRISPNSTNPRNGKITKIIPHHMAGNLTVETCASVFAPTSRQASSHYGIGSDGRVGMYCEEKNRAWTTGNQIDHQAVTIEVADDVIGNKYGQGWHTSDAALNKLVVLCADICRRNGIKKLAYTGDGSGNLLMHRWYQSTDCPGDYLASKFTWLALEVNKLLGGNYLTRGDVNQAVKAMQIMLIALGYSCGASGADGSFGPDTEAALKRFQAAKGLAVDGCYGGETMEKLDAAYAANQKKPQKPEWDNVYLDAMSGQDKCRWRLVPVSKGAAGEQIYKIMHKASGKFLDVTETIKNNTNVVVFKDSGTPGQRWIIRHVTHGEADYVEIVPASNTAMLLSAEDNGITSNNIKLWEDLHNSKQKFYLRQETNGDYYIIHGFSLKGLTA